MKIIKQLITYFKTRNWFELRLNPDELFDDEWYTVSMDIKKDKDGTQYYSDIMVILKNVNNVKFSNKALTKEEVVRQYDLSAE